MWVDARGSGLVVYLTERFGGHERAILASKVMLVDGERRSQLPSVAFARQRDYADELVHAVQSRIEADPAGHVSVDDLTRDAGVSPRTLGRRFNVDVGETPRRYLQTIRIETAKRQLEMANDPVDQIRLRVGYSGRDGLPSGAREAHRPRPALLSPEARSTHGIRGQAPGQRTQRGANLIAGSLAKE